MEARSVASYSNALDFAYKALEKFEGERPEDEENLGTGANCHKLIMIFRYSFSPNIHGIKLPVIYYMTIYLLIQGFTFYFSDGFTERLDKVIAKYQAESMNLTKHVRIFSYAVGPHPLPVTALKDMACAAHGSFSTITAMGAIRTQIQVGYSQTNFDNLRWK